MEKPENFWNEKYKGDSYYFGTKPNAWVKQTLDKLGSGQGKRLLELACGEGRNANYAASLGYEVLATDVSEKGLEKAALLAQKNGHKIETRIFDVLDDSDALPLEGCDVLLVTFLHFVPEKRSPFYKRLRELVAPKGHLIAEWYHPRQRLDGYTSGGPPDSDMMPTLSELEENFAKEPWKVQSLAYTLETLDEGPGHNGLAALSRIHAVREA